MLNRMLTVASLIAVAGFAGCAGHGSYTQEGLRKSQNAMAGIKAMNDHQQAEQSFKAGDLDKAMKMIDRSLASNPNVPISYVLRGRILIEKGDLENALLCFQKAEALKPELVDSQYYMGIVYERFTQNEDALKHYMKAGELDPSNPQYAVAAAEMMIDLDRVNEARELLGGRRRAVEKSSGGA